MTLFLRVLIWNPCGTPWHSMFLVVVLAFACISVEGFSLFPLVTDGIRLKVTCRTVGHSACMMVRVSVTVRGWIMRSGDPSVSLVGLVMDLVSAGMIRASQAECGPRFIHQFLA